MFTLCAFTDSPEASRSFARTLAEALDVGDLVILAGDLGAGKTCFTQGLATGLEVDARVTSPTFTLANQYQGRLLLHHLDVYRIESIHDTLDLDLPELLETGLTVIEWGEQILPALGDDYLVVRLLLGEGDDDRHLRLEAGTDRWQTRLESIAGSLQKWVVEC